MPVCRKTLNEARSRAHAIFEDFASSYRYRTLAEAFLSYVIAAHQYDSVDVTAELEDLRGMINRILD